MRAMLINVLAIVLTAVLGIVILKALSRDAHLPEMYLAGGAILVAVEIAVVPLILTRRANQADVSQSGLVATAVHLFFSAGLGGAILMLLHPAKPFLYWMLAFYWTTLSSLCVSIIVAIRKAPPLIAKP